MALSAKRTSQSLPNVPRANKPRVSGTVTSTSIPIAVDGEPEHKSWVIRWGIHNDGVQDTAIGYTETGNFDITQVLSNVTLAGNDIDVWAFAFANTYKDGNDALTSAEYLSHSTDWSDLLNVQVPTK